MGNQAIVKAPGVAGGVFTSIADEDAFHDTPDALRKVVMPGASELPTVRNIIKEHVRLKNARGWPKSTSRAEVRVASLAAWLPSSRRPAATRPDWQRAHQWEALPNVHSPQNIHYNTEKLYASQPAIGSFGTNQWCGGATPTTERTVL